MLRDYVKHKLQNVWIIYKLLAVKNSRGFAGHIKFTGGPQVALVSLFVQSCQGLR